MIINKTRELNRVIDKIGVHPTQRQTIFTELDRQTDVNCSDGRLVSKAGVAVEQLVLTLKSTVPADYSPPPELPGALGGETAMISGVRPTLTPIPAKTVHTLGDPEKALSDHARGNMPSWATWDGALKK